MEDKAIVASKTISGKGQSDFMTKCKNAEKEGWQFHGNPMTAGEFINQVVIKTK